VRNLPQVFQRVSWGSLGQGLGSARGGAGILSLRPFRFSPPSQSRVFKEEPAPGGWRYWIDQPAGAGAIAGVLNMGILAASHDETSGAANWNTLAELDPLWAILSDPQKRSSGWDRAEFFSTGDQEANRVLAMCRSHGISVSYGKLLDFGCGVGRMTRAFSRHFESCVGIDVSEKMIGLAREFNAGHPRCEFIASDAGVLPFVEKSFDFVFTVLVLQHLASRSMILEYIAEFIRVAKDNATIVFQLPNEVPLRRRIQIRRRLWPLLESLGIPPSWLFNKLGLAPILLNGVPRKEIEGFVATHGGQVRAVERYDPAEDNYHSYYYFVSRQPRLSSYVGEELAAEGLR